MKRVVVALPILLLLLAAGAAQAKPKPDPAAADKEAARRAYDLGTKAYNLGDFQGAIKHYKEAYNLVPEPVFLYNIAQSYRLASDLPQALFFYKSFLRNQPDASNRIEVEGRVNELEVQLAQQHAAASRPPNDVKGLPTPEQAAETSDAATEQATPPGPIVPTDQGSTSRPIYKKWWFWAGIGAVAAGTVAIVVVAGSHQPSGPDSHFGTGGVF